MLNPPTVGGPWTAYVCTVCVKGTTTCVVEPQCPAIADGRAVCPLPGLQPDTAYSLTCVAIKPDGTKSPPSNSADLQTSQAPATAVHAESTSPTTGTAEVTPPAAGGPWAKYDLRVCLLTKGVLVAAASLNCTTVTCSPVAVPPAHTLCALSGLEDDAE